jgi:hypothetical protein
MTVLLYDDKMFGGMGGETGGPIPARPSLPNLAVYENMTPSASLQDPTVVHDRLPQQDALRLLLSQRVYDHVEVGNGTTHYSCRRAPCARIICRLDHKLRRSYSLPNSTKLISDGGGGRSTCCHSVVLRLVSFKGFALPAREAKNGNVECAGFPDVARAITELKGSVVHIERPDLKVTVLLDGQLVVQQRPERIQTGRIQTGMSRRIPMQRVTKHT